MMLKIKDWCKFQHFKDRKPPWIKLYRDILDDMQWNELNGDDAKALVMIWLIASESDGVVPPCKELAFRLRTTEKVIKSTVSRLSHWLIQDDITAISTGNNDIRAISERYHADDANDINVKALTRSQETETETETETDDARFEQFWKPYPKKVGRPSALKAWKAQRINGELSAILFDIENKKASDSWQKNNGEYIPYPATYLNQRRWEDSQDLIGHPDPFAGAVN